MDLILYCSVFCSNILAVAETHKKHVPIFNLCDVLCFPHLGLIMVTCLVKKKQKNKERERERERERESVNCLVTWSQRAVKEFSQYLTSRLKFCCLA